MKLDDKWRKKYETFLNVWVNKVQELESIEDKLVDDETKRIWLTNTLQSNKDMDSAVRQAITTELTVSGLNGGSHQVTWSHFYRIVLSTAKMLDDTSSHQAPKRQSNQAAQGRGGRGNGGHGRDGNRGGPGGGGRPNTTPRPYTQYTGKDMIMQPGMFFSPTDWKKLTESQQNQLRGFKRNANSTSVTSTPDTTPTTSSNTSSPGSNVNVRQLLSNAAGRPSTSAPEQPAPTQVIFAGRTYTLNLCSIQYSVNQHQCKSLGALIDGGSNGGLSGCDVQVLECTHATADITGIGEYSLQHDPICTVADGS